MNDHPMSSYLERYPPVPDPERDQVSQEQSVHRVSPRNLPVEQTIDLHGMTREQAQTELELFLTRARAEGIRKVLVIHGKGSHGEGDATLRNFTREFLERHPFVGPTGTPGIREGGSGATWAILRQRSR